MNPACGALGSKVGIEVFVKNIGLLLASLLVPRVAFAAKRQKVESTKGGSINLSGPAYVTEVLHWSSPAYSRISVTLDHEARYEHRLLKQDSETALSPRICIDIKTQGCQSGSVTFRPVTVS